VTWGAKLGILAAAALLAAAMLAVLHAGAAKRGLETHCRNNLRHLGGLAARNWNALDPSRTGRSFWQGVREAQYRDVRGKWQAPDPDPFVCPVHARTATKLDDPAAIDYRGPRKVREELKQTPAGEPLGSDRPGNHASGGFVLRLDTSVQEVPAILDRTAEGDPLWKAAGDALQD
jgi:hypothetical protein